MPESKAGIDQVNRRRLVGYFASRLLALLLLVCSPSVLQAQVTVKGAKLKIQGDDEWRGWLNGNEIGEGQGWSTVFEPVIDPKWFKPCGKNVLAVWFKD